MTRNKLTGGRPNGITHYKELKEFSVYHKELTALRDDLKGLMAARQVLDNDTPKIQFNILATGAKLADSKYIKLLNILANDVSAAADMHAVAIEFMMDTGIQNGTETIETLKNCSSNIFERFRNYVGLKVTEFTEEYKDDLLLAE